MTTATLDAPQTTTAPASFADLLREALEQPGTINRAYFAFHGFSIGNQLLAMLQCSERGIQPGSIATFPRWKERGRYVRRGEKALTLCMPITCKRRPTETPDPQTTESAEPGTFTRFIFRPRWFVLSQTDGNDYQPEPLAAWDKALALATLNITEEPFTATDGNCFGYAHHRTIAVSPLCPRPWRTILHEIAHIVLGHTDHEQQQDGPQLTRSTKEVEAEAVSYLVAAALDLPGAEDSRGYLASWRQGQPIEETTARRIFKTADQILRAGREAAATTETEGDE